MARFSGKIRGWVVNRPRAGGGIDNVVRRNRAIIGVSVNWDANRAPDQARFPLDEGVGYRAGGTRQTARNLLTSGLPGKGRKLARQD